jgi:hypothetical protein
MRKRPIPISALAMLLLATCSWPATVHVASPRLRHADDTRSAFSWAPGPASFPQSATVHIRVTDQYRPQPNPWEVAWVVLGDDHWFIAFVPKPTGWHLEAFDTEANPSQHYVASGSSITYPPGEPITVSMTGGKDGIEVSAESWRTRDGRRQRVRLATFIGWTAMRPPPSWWGKPMRAGVYVEDCTAELEWR